MKRRVISILLVLALVLTSGDFTAFAAEQTDVVESAGEEETQETEESTIGEEYAEEEKLNEETDVEKTTVGAGGANETTDVILSMSEETINSTDTIEETFGVQKSFYEENTEIEEIISYEGTDSAEDIESDIEDVANTRGQCGDNVWWSLEDNVLTISGTGEMWDYTHLHIASWIGASSSIQLNIEEGITTIPKRAFYDCNFVGNLVIPESVIIIGEDAFSRCNGFTGDLIIPDNVKNIGIRAFERCNGFTGDLIIGNGVKKIEEDAFKDCSGFSGKLVLGNSVTEIGDDAFNDCSAFTGSLEIPNSAIKIGEGAFWGCNGFNGKLTISNNVTIIGEGAFCDCSGFTGSLEIPNGVTEIGGAAFSGCSGFTGELAIPENVTTIENSVFGGCTGFTGELIIPENVTTIGEGAFFRCTGFTGNLIIPNEVTNIGDSAFSECSGLSGNLIIPNGVTNIGDSAFSECSGLTGELIIPDGITVINDSTFFKCSGFTGNLIIPNSVTSIGNYAFFSCSNLTGDLVIPDSITNVGFNAFTYCNGFEGDLIIGNGLTQIDAARFPKGFKGRLVIGRNVNSIGSSTFYGCSGFTGDLIIPNGVTSIEYGTFDGCYGFTGNLIIPESVTSIGNYAFDGCSGFTGDLIIPNNVTSIGDYAFHNCDGFTGDLIIGDSVKSIGWRTFAYCDGFSGDLVIGDSVINIDVEAFWDTDGFSGDLIIGNSLTEIPELRGNFAGRLVIGNSIQSIKDYAFSMCGKFSGNLTIPNSVTWIGDNAFSGCSGFTGTLTIPDSITEVGESAFSGCSGFNGKLTLPKSLTEIKASSFSGCSGFTGELIISNQITMIGSEAFANCSGFTGNLTIPNSVTEIEKSAFSGCSGFNGNLTLPISLTQIKASSFADCSGFMGKLTIPNQVTLIGSKAFANCSGFTGTLTIPNNVSEIGENAFSGCSGFNGKLTLPISLTQISASSFADCSGFTGKLTIPNQVTLIGSKAFANCSGFTGTLTIPNGVTEIGGSAFANCTGFNDKLILSKGLKTIGSSAFSNCSGISGKLTIEKKVRTIQSSAFSGCSSLTGDLEVPSSVTNIGSNAFDNCTSLNGNAYIPATVIYIGSNAFPTIKLICGEKDTYAESYAKTNNITFKSTNEIETVNPDGITINSNEVAICAVDSQTGKIIPFSEIYIDGEKFETGFDGVLRITGRTGQALIDAQASGYGVYIVPEPSKLTLGTMIKIYLTKSNSTPIISTKYISGKLESADVFTATIVIDGKKYTTDDNFEFVDAETKLINQFVICTLIEDKVSDLELLTDCIRPNIFILPENNNISYSDGKYSTKEMKANVNIKYKTTKGDSYELLKNVNGISVPIQKVTIESDSSAFEFKKDELFQSKKTKLELEINKNIDIQNEYNFDIIIYPRKEYVPNKVSNDINVNSFTTYNGKEVINSYKMHFNNLDLQKKENAHKKESDKQKKIDSLKKQMQSKSIVSLSSLEPYFDNKQRAQMEEFLTVWVADIIMAPKAAYEISGKEKFAEQICKKIGINIKKEMFTFISESTASVRIEAETKQHGRRTVMFTLQLKDFHLGETESFATFGDMSWQIEKSKDIESNGVSGIVGMVATANVDLFANQLKNIAIDEVKEAYNQVWGNKANIVANMLVNETIMEIIDEQYGSFSNMVFKLITEPTNRYVKSKTKCPVDIYVYNSDNVLCGAIINNEVYPINEEVSLYVDEEQAKYVTYCEDKFYLKLVGTDAGTMNHYIEEYSDVGECIRTITYENVPLTDNIIYHETIPDYLYADNSVYDLISEDGDIVNSDSDTYQDTVEPYVFVDGINIEETDIKLEKGETKQLIANVTPETAMNKLILWESEDETVASVDATGVVTAIAEGTTSISALSVEGRYSINCNITVDNVSQNKLSMPKADYETGSSIRQGTHITLSSEENAVIYYTIDGTVPATDSWLYSEPIVVNADITIKAIAVKEGYKNSDIATFVYTIAQEQYYTVTFNLKGGTDIPVQSVIENGKVAKPTEPTREGYIFKGWYLDNVLYDFDTVVTSDIILEAQWEEVETEKSSEEESPTEESGSIEESDIESSSSTEESKPEESSSVEESSGIDENDSVLPSDIPQTGIPNGLWIAGVNDVTYTGKAIKPSVRVYDHKTRLTEKRDYTVSYKNNVNANNASDEGKAPSVIIKAKGNYSGKETATFKILPIDINVTGFGTTDIAVNPNQKVQKPIPVVTYNGKKLSNKKDFTVTYPDKSANAYKEKGSYPIKITGQGNYTGEKTINLLITDNPLMTKAKVSKISSQQYTGKALTPTVQVKYGKTILKQGTDYELAYQNNVKIGTAYAIIKGKGGYSGQKVVPFLITGMTINKATVTGLDTPTAFNGTAITKNITLAMTVNGNPKILKAGQDYTVIYQNNKNAGTATVILTGINSYSGTLKKTFKINPYDLQTDTNKKISYNKKLSVPYAKNGSCPEPEIYFNKTKLKKDRDYSLSYKNNKAVNSGISPDTAPVVVVKGKGNFKGTLSISFAITSQDMSKLTLTVSDKEYKNRANIFATNITVTDTNGKTLSAGQDYDKGSIVYTYANAVKLENGISKKAGAVVEKTDIIPVGTKIQVSVTAKAGGYYTGTAKGIYRIIKSDIKKAKVSIPVQTYTGEAIVPKKSDIMVTVGVTKLTESEFEIVGCTNNIKKGNATITLKGKGNYGGTKTVRFKIQSKGFLWWWRK